MINELEDIDFDIDFDDNDDNTETLELTTLHLDELPLTQEDIEHLILARYYYSFGVDYMNDTLYESEMAQLKKEQPNHWLIHTHWSKDPLPLNLLHKYNLPYMENKLSDCLEELTLPEDVEHLREDYLSHYESRYGDLSQKSIELIQDYDTVYERLSSMLLMQNNQPIRLHCSIKADGQNFTATYFKGKLVHGKTKGRTGSPLDITKVLRIVLPKELETDEEVIQISGELVCFKHSLPYLRNSYRQAFKSTRSAVSTLLRGGLSTEDIFNHLKPLVFKVRSEHLHTLADEFTWAKSHNFNTPAWITMHYRQWADMEKLFAYFTPYKEGLPYSSDGIVVAIDNNETFYAQGETDHHYLGNMALKVGVWNPGYYVGLVKDIKWSYGETAISPEAVIEPVLVKHGSHVTSIPLDHIKRLIDHNITIGSEIYFKVTGDSKITLVHREEELENIVIENQR